MIKGERERWKQEMFSLTSSFRYYLYREPTDMRKSFGAPGQAWQSQRVEFPLQQEYSQLIENRVLNL